MKSEKKRQTRHAAKESCSSPDNRSRARATIFLGAIAFCAGAILTWVILSQLPRSAPVPEQKGDDVLPDVSALSPSEGALTLGNWYFDHHQWAIATEQYRKAISLGLDNADVRSDLGSALRFNNRPEAAAAEYATAQQENPEHENSLFNLATLYLQSLNQPDRAATLLEEFKARFPRSGAIPRVDELIQEAKKKQVGTAPTASVTPRRAE
jgi:tetratricopeptide (TPR) repeat protein